MNSLNILITYFTKLKETILSNNNSNYISNHINLIISHIELIDEESEHIPNFIKIKSLINNHNDIDIDSDVDSDLISSYETDTDDEETNNSRSILESYDKNIKISTIQNVLSCELQSL
jgi:hypothetical protein